MRRIQVALSVATALMVVAAVTDPASAAPPTVTTQPPATVAVGETVVIAGGGCPPTGPYPVDVTQGRPVVLWVQPPTTGTEPLFSNYAQVAAGRLIGGGTVGPLPVFVPVDSDAGGNWSAQIQIPASLTEGALTPPEPGPGYTIKGQCLTLLRQEGDTAGFTASSVAEAKVDSAPFAVAAPPTSTTTSTVLTSSTTATTSVAARTVSAAPRFTG